MPQRKLHIFDTQTRMVEEITPEKDSLIRMYTCGPTVYDFAHIGNFRTFLFEDMLRRTLQLFGYTVTQVMNLTDVDDKTIRQSLVKNIPLAQYTEQYKKAFFEDLSFLRIQKAEQYPEATAYIPQMIAMISALVDKKAAYIHTDKSVYFSLSAAKEYGKLSHLKTQELQTQKRALSSTDSYEKEDLQDFVLWKAYDEKRDGSVFWESPWGKGRPGWHIECSVMAKELLGETIDIHAGGVDLIFPHHENEIAQSETCTGKPFSRYWVHAEHLLVDHKKMSKSLGNFYTLRDLIEKGYDPVAIRFFLLSNHYRTQLNFSLESIEAASASIKRIRDCVQRIETEAKKQIDTEEFLKKVSSYKEDFLNALAHDLHANEAVATVFDLIRYVNHTLDSSGISENEASILKDFFAQFDAIFDILRADEKSIPEEIQQLLDQRAAARKRKDYAASDTLRNKIFSLGYIVEDLPEGQRVQKDVQQKKN